MSDTAKAYRLLLRAEEELSLMSLCAARAEAGEHPQPETVGDYMAWIADELKNWRAELNAPTDETQVELDKPVQAADIAYGEALLAQLEKLGFQKRPLPWDDIYAHLEYDEKGGLDKIHIHYDCPEGAGQLLLEMGGYGPYIFNPAWSMSDPFCLVDLNYNSPAARAAAQALPELNDQAERLMGARPGVQLVVYGVDRGDTLGMIKFWREQTLATFEPTAGVLAADEDHPALPIIGFIDEE